MQLILFYFVNMIINGKIAADSYYLRSKIVFSDVVIAFNYFIEEFQLASN